MWPDKGGTVFGSNLRPGGRTLRSQDGTMRYENLTVPMPERRKRHFPRRRLKWGLGGLVLGLLCGALLNFSPDKPPASVSIGALSQPHAQGPAVNLQLSSRLDAPPDTDETTSNQ